MKKLSLMAALLILMGTVIISATTSKQLKHSQTVKSELSKTTFTDDLVTLSSLLNADDYAKKHNGDSASTTDAVIAQWHYIDDTYSDAVKNGGPAGAAIEAICAYNFWMCIDQSGFGTHQYQLCLHSYDICMGRH